MRTNFALAREDIITNIRLDLLKDPLSKDFKQLIPNAEAFGDELWGYFVDRVSNLHGTELAAQLTDNLASFKRKIDSSQSKRMQPKNAALLEQLRAAKKQKKLMRHTELVQDLTGVREPEEVTSAVAATEQDRAVAATEQPRSCVRVQVRGPSDS